MQCPLKRIEAAIVAAEPGNAIGENIKMVMHEKDCDSDCAWHVDGNCAIAVLAKSRA